MLADFQVTKMFGMPCCLLTDRWHGDVSALNIGDTSQITIWEQLVCTTNGLYNQWFLYICTNIGVQRCIHISIHITCHIYIIISCICVYITYIYIHIFYLYIYITYIYILSIYI